MRKLFLVAAGGVIGSLLRYLLTESLGDYPFAIFIANLLGVAIAGLVAYRLNTSEASRAFLIPGVAGGMTTFSSVALIHAQQNSVAAIAYFYGLVAASLLVLYFLRAKAAQ